MRAGLVTVPYHQHATEAAAVTAMRAGSSGADAKMTAYQNVCHNYWRSLPDGAGDRPYAAGQLTLNTAITAVQTLATANGWVVPTGVDTPNTANPCHLPWLPYTP